MFEKQAQDVTGGSTAIQAGGSVTINQTGISVSEVRELVHAFMQLELPAFRKEARAVASENTHKLLEAFVAKATIRNSPISGREFAKPAGQAAFQSAVEGVALHGDESDIDLVAEVLLSRLEAGEEPLLKRVLDSAINVLPKLTASQIAFLGMVVYVKSLQLSSVKDIGMLEGLAATMQPLFAAGMNLSRPNVDYMAGLGLLTINAVSDADQLFASWSRMYGFPIDQNVVASSKSTHLEKLHQAYVALRVPTVYLTLIGSIIGLLHLKRRIKNINIASFFS